MMCLQLLFLCSCSSILAVASCFRVGGYSCVSAYWNTVMCVLNITGNPVGQFWLEFIESEEVFRCPLVLMNPSYSCVCNVTKSENLGSGYVYDIKLCQKSVCHTVTKDFEPSLNIQPTPPHQPEIQEAPETFNITWKSGYEGHRYLKSVLDYEVLLQTSQSTETKTSYLKPRETSVLIPRSQLKPRATCCIKVRSIPNNNYEGTWSEWSPSTCWKNEAGKEGEDEDNTFVILIKSLVPVCVAVGVLLLFVLYSPAVRMKIKTLSHTPTPAPFFQPLFQQHGGNLQKWLSPQGKMVQTYKTEELLTTAVIVVPKPVTKDPEENQVFHNPTVQLALTQCQTSYVGLPVMHEASPPVPMVCPGETSYTRLPCSVWDVGIEEVDVVSTLPKDFFNSCSSDSGCSFEDPSQSPECSLPNSPVDDNPPPCFCNDYCILNKIAGGFVPVLLSKESSLSVPSNPLLEE